MVGANRDQLLVIGVVLQAADGSLMSAERAVRLSLQRLPDKAGVSPKVTSFALPLEVVFNRDGSAMFVCIAAIFVAQTYGMVLDIGSILVLG